MITVPALTNTQPWESYELSLPDYDQAEVVRELVNRGGLRTFAEEFFDIVEPSVQFIPGWHIDAICDHLEAVTREEITKLVINVPPGHMKSLLVNVMWPCWEWTFRPGSRWAHASCDVSLMHRDARKALSILQSNRYRQAWPDFEMSDRQLAVSDFRNEHGGHRFSTSPGGKFVGHHFHTQVGDDLVKPSAAESKNPAVLAEAAQWWSNTASTRRVPGAIFKRVLIMQRLAYNDPAGICLREENYEHLCLEFDYFPRKVWDFGSSITRSAKNAETKPGEWHGKDPRTEPGEILWPQCYDDEKRAELKKSLKTASNWESQAQQNPQPKSGAIIEPGWLRIYDVLPDLEGAFLVQSWDFTHKGTQEAHSRVHGALWAMLVERKRYLLLDEWYHLAKYPDARKKFLALQKKPLWERSNKILIEGKASGVALIQDVKEMAPSHINNRIVEVNPREDKVIRFIVHSDKFEMGEVWIPSEELLPTSTDFKNHIEMFPSHGTDRGDTTSQALDFFDEMFGRFEGGYLGLAVTQ